jgi:hypothetical protein
MGPIPGNAVRQPCSYAPSSADSAQVDEAFRRQRQSLELRVIATEPNFAGYDAKILQSGAANDNPAPRGCGKI